MDPQKPKIIIVDKEPHILETLAIALTNAGYEPFKALTGKQAIKLIESHSPALVITDIRVSGLNGLKFLRQIKAFDADIEIIVLTGFATLNNAINALTKGGACNFLTKPLDNLDTLLEAIKQALSRWSNNRNNRKRATELSKANEALLHRLNAQTAELLKLNARLQMETKARHLAEATLDALRKRSEHTAGFVLPPAHADREEKIQEVI